MLYNIKKSFATHHIKDGIHNIYFEEYGNPEGIPVLFLHGGPGSGCSDSHKAIFDNKKLRVVFWDQRGSGKSIPKRETRKNTTQILIKDIENIRDYLNVKTWFLVGGSWGATLAIAYAEKYSNRVKGIVLRSLFLATKKEIEWAFLEAPLYFRPQLIYDMNMALNLEPYKNPIPILGKYLESDSINKNCIGAELWLEYESNLSTLENKKNKINEIINNNDFSKERIKRLPNTPFMEWHFIKNNFFLEDNQLHINKFNLTDIPIRIVQSNYDLLCPPKTSYMFIKGLKKAKIININAGHYMSDPGIKEKLIEIINDITNE